MVYRVADLVDTPHLRVELQARCRRLGPTGAWAQTSDLEEPWSYLAGGELLMKNGQTLPESARGQTALISGLAENGMCGMVIGLDAATPELTPAAIALADQLRFPVMAVPYSVGFGAIGRAVADADVDSGRVVADRTRLQRHPAVGDPLHPLERPQPTGPRPVLPAGGARRGNGRGGAGWFRTGA